MGVLTDFVVGSPVDAKRIGDSANPCQEFGGLDAKGIDQVKMGKLFAVLTCKEYDPAFLTTDTSFVYAASDDGPWVQLVPQEMVTLLAALPDHEIPRVAVDWSRTEEFQLKDISWTSGEIEPLVRELVKLSRRAMNEGKALPMWTCL